MRWKLDVKRGTAAPEDASVLRGFSVPVRPMLGGLALAPGFGAAPLSTGDTGRSGGNMDFNEVVEGNTVYLPIQRPGALLYLGHAHALQEQDYKLSLSECAQVLGTSVRYSVANLAGRSVGVAAKIDKSVLSPLAWQVAQSTPQPSPRK